MLKLLLAASVALAPVSAPSQPVTSVPIDLAARAKFPADKPEQVDAVAYVNAIVNANITYVSDQEHYGVTDHYVSLPPDNKGDCEDYALSKMEILSAAGFPVVTSAKLVAVIVHYKDKAGKPQEGGHMILAVRLPSGAVAYLDQAGDLKTRPELEAKGYEFFDWKA